LAESGGPTNGATKEAIPTATKVLLLATPPDHPYGSHMYAFDCGVLARCLRQTPGVTAEYSLGWPSDATLWDQLDAVVFYSSPAGEIVLSPEHREKFRQLMRQGVGYSAIHWATSVGYSKLADDQSLRDEYRRTLGGWFRRPPCDLVITRTALQQALPEHPICRGWEAFELHDEFYLNLVFDERADPLLRIIHDGKPQTVAWTIERDEPAHGRSFGTVLGHFHENFARPEFRRFLVNGILWTAHREIPDGGAAVELSDQEVTLPEPAATAPAVR